MVLMVGDHLEINKFPNHQFKGHQLDSRGKEVHSDHVCHMFDNMPHLVSRSIQNFFGQARAKSQGGKILIGRSTIESEGNFVQPTNVEISSSAPVVKEELFGHVLYVMKFQGGLTYHLEIVEGCGRLL